MNAGGDLVIFGTQDDGRPWRIGIANPLDRDESFAWLDTTDQAVVTSGNYENYVEVDGRRLSHILDPRTGLPVEELRGVTIVCPDGELADALATGVSVLGVEKGLALVGPWSPGGPAGERVAERLPDSRLRKAAALRLNHSFSDRFVLRTGYRYYSDDWGITAHTIDLEPHFRLRSDREMWLFPILRYGTQTGADYFGIPGTFTGSESYYTSDWGLAETTMLKYGLGWTVNTRPGQTWLGILRRFEARATVYDRDDGLTAFSTSFAFGWTY